MLQRTHNRVNHIDPALTSGMNIFGSWRSITEGQMSCFWMACSFSKFRSQLIFSSRPPESRITDPEVKSCQNNGGCRAWIFEMKKRREGGGKEDWLGLIRQLKLNIMSHLKPSDPAVIDWLSDMINRNIFPRARESTRHLMNLRSEDSVSSRSTFNRATL